VFGFAVIWHIWWLATAGMLGLIVSAIIRMTDDDTEYVLSARDVAKIETQIATRSQAA
jgi:cytochrome o ubiquinol oxidase subunit 1